MPTSSAAAERSWIMYKSIHYKLRNQLLSETVQKLMFINSSRNSDEIPEVIFDPAALDWWEDGGDTERQACSRKDEEGSAGLFIDSGF
ncbi:hypothetical protein P3T76_004346 [Phytophthora citrophthora]|uniref:HAT C-terminal dimerisation domain-containing protein n=1 Tax=Phytophthora citrophthora TaxID=4793 RepID=A0AAD9GTP2_9STRA|nr:hypothetical protein P3T76_004346 [Phytophthora citrophthora]